MNKNVLAFSLIASLSMAGCSLNHSDTTESTKLSSKETQIHKQASDLGVPAKQGELRVAVFNAYLNRKNAGDILADVQSGNDTQIKKVAEIIQRVRPEVLLLAEFDYVADGSAVRSLLKNYLNVSQNGVKGIDYPYFYLAESNTGIVTEFDLNNDGNVGIGGGDAFGFGVFPGQYAMVLLSQHPIITEEVRTFQKFLWKDMPNATLPVKPQTGEAWYSDEELEIFRLSSKSHWDVPVQVGDEVIHVLASHPTPPVFDGKEDRNGLRNHDEIRFWWDYVNPNRSDYIYDDKGQKGGLGENKRFVIMGDLNASPDEGNGTGNPVAKLFASTYINADKTPMSVGGVENAPQNAFSATHTAGWKMRADYVIPSRFGLQVEQTAIFWPSKSEPHYHLVGPGLQSSDHRLVWADFTLIDKDDDKK